MLKIKINRLVHETKKNIFRLNRLVQKLTLYLAKKNIIADEVGVPRRRSLTRRQVAAYEM